ncbi:MAG: 3-phosphoshikimate 1-carboxyvinyltransferase [Bacillota bacterium]|jgi:3-phosphoshikimate 1-carboxyvinyltransferase
MHSQDFYEVPQLTKPLNCTITVPGSKSITNRALLLAALATEPVELENVLFCDDSRNFIAGLQTLGFQLEVAATARRVKVHGRGGLIPERRARIDVGSAGTAARFLTALLALSPGEYLVEASPQMMARPMQPLLDSLTALGARFDFLGQPNCLPYKIYGTGNRHNRVTLQANISSQFLSALLLAGAGGHTNLEIEIDGPVAAKPYVAMTVAMLRQFGVTAENYDYQRFIIPAGQTCHGAPHYAIEPDISNANYFYALAILTGGSVLVKGVRLGALQGDIQFLKVLQQLGGALREEADGVRVTGPRDGIYPGITADLGATPDQSMTLAALAPFATGPTVIKNVGIIKYHESNRLRAIRTELTKMGIDCEEKADGLIIRPGLPRVVTVATYDDHRMAMAFALTGVRVAGMRIANPGCTAKTFAGFFELLDALLI